MRAGFIGLGNQGMPMARRIAQAGIPVTVWARRPEVAASAREWGAELSDSPAEVGAMFDVLGICVFDATGVDEVLFGPHGVLESAAAGELLVLPAGPADARRRVEPVVDSYAGRVIHFPEVGSAQLAKLINNTLLAAQMALVADAVRLGRRHGLGCELHDVLRAGSARGFAVDLFANVGSLNRLAQSAFTPTMGKDVRLLQGVAEQSSSMLDLAAELTCQLNVKDVATP